MIRSGRKYIVRLLVLLCISTGAFRLMDAQSQAFSAGITGVIYDSSKAVVSGVTVTALSTDRGIHRVTTTSEDGRYTFTLLPPGTYTLSTEKPGFRTTSRPAIAIGVGENATADLTLQVGNVSERVTVTSAAPILDTSDANISSDVSQKSAVELPLNLRNVYGLVLLNSAVSNKSDAQWQAGSYQATADQDVAFLNFGGTRFGSTAYLLDGHWNSGSDWDSVIYVPGVDELEEMKLQTNTFSAQYGWTMGSVVNAVTKSGTSTFHGSAFEFFRDSALDANNYFNNAAGVAKPDFRRNQFGFSAGGPLYVPGLYKQRDRTFFFAYYEGLRQQSPVTLVTTVPTSGFKNGDFSALLGPRTGTDALGRAILSGQVYNPFSTRQITAGQVDPSTGLMARQSGYIRDPFSGNILPASLLDNVAKNLLQYWPSPTGSGLVNNFTATSGAPATGNQYTIRVDHNLNDSTRLFVRWSQKYEQKEEQAALFGVHNPGGPGSTNPNNRWDFALNLSKVFSPTFIASANVGWNRWVEATNRQGVPFQPSTLGLPSFLDTNPGAFPNINVDGAASLGNGQAYAIPREDRTFAIDFTKVRKAHSVNFGFTLIDFQYRDRRIPTAAFNFPTSFTQGPDPNAPVNNTGAGFASLLLGTANSGSFPVDASPALSKNYLGWYVQDDYKATPKLTLNLGIRYDMQTAPRERFNRMATFNFNGTNPISAAIGTTVPGYIEYASGGLYQPQRTNVAPRLGFSYSPHTGLVLRGGFGLLYTTAMAFPGGGGDMPGYSVATPFVGTLDGITPFSTLRHAFSSGMTPITGSALGKLTDVGLDTTAVSGSRPTPYVEQWTFGLQYALGTNDSVEAQYIGNHGLKLPISGGIQRNQLPDQYLSLGNQLLAPVANPFAGHISASGCGLDQPAIPRGQLLRPFPEFCSVYEMQPTHGFSNYNAAEFKYTHQWSHDLQVMVSFTVSKYLDNTTGTEGWSTLSGPEFRNYNNLKAEKSLDGNDIPKSLVLSYIYELPLGTGKRFGGGSNRTVNAVLGGWQLSGIGTFKDGFPLTISSATNNTNSFGGNQRPNIIAGLHTDHPSITKWFNTDAFALPSPFTFGNAPRTLSGLRSPGYNNWDLAIQKWWTVNERVKLQFRTEMFNAFNRTNFTDPNTTYGSPQFGTISSAFAARDIQFAGKLYW